MSKSKKSFRILLLGGAIPLAALAGAGAANAQTSQTTVSRSPQVAEVTVTAQKRKEKLQNVPIAVTAVSAAQLQAAGVNQIGDLGKVAPSLQFTQAVGIYAEPVMRSVGTTTHGPGIENPIAVYVDGVYFVAATSSLMTLFDVDQVAVLKGPQGTLFGRNATGGLIQITTKLPTQAFHADLEETYGNVGTFNQDLYVNGGITPTLAANFALSHDDQGEGFGHNIYNGSWVGTFHDLSMRGKLRWQPDAATDVILSADYAHREGTDVDTRANDGLIGTGKPEPGGWWDIDNNISPYERDNGNGTNLTGKHDFGPAQIVSITAYRANNEYSYEDGNDLTTPSVEIITPQLDHQFSEELQLLSPDNQRLTWTTGLYYLNADSRYDPQGKIAYNSPTNQDYGHEFVNSRVQSFAAFAQGTYKIDPSTNFTAGLRYTGDFRVFNASNYDNHAGVLNPNGTQTFTGPFIEDGVFSDKKNWIRPSGRISLDHRFSPELMVYGSYNRGFRSGTFSPGALPNAELKPETLDAFEAGLKSDLFNHRLRFNASSYFYEYHNRQVQAVYSGVQYDYDARTAQSYGIDGDITGYLTDQLSLTGGFSAIHAVYTNFNDAYITTANPSCRPGACSTVNLVNPAGNATGNWVENTPFWTINVTPTYVIPSSAGDVTLTASWFHSAGFYAAPDNRVKQNPYDTLAADISWTPSFAPQLSIRVWGKNITNTQYAVNITESNSVDNATVAAGRTFGVTLDQHF